MSYLSYDKTRDASLQVGETRWYDEAKVVRGPEGEREQNMK